MRRFTSWALLLVFGSAVAILSAQSPPAAVVTELTVTPEAAGALRDWDDRVNGLLRTGELVRRTVRTDTILPDRINERLDQYVNGVRVFGGELVRQTRRGVTESLFGTVYDAIRVGTVPTLSEDDARAKFAALSGAELPADRILELTILPKDDGGYSLTWRAHVWMGKKWMHTFIDAHNGVVVHQYDDRHQQSAVGVGTGVLGDRKKVSATASAGRFAAIDGLRPPLLVTYDLNGDIFRTEDILNGVARVASSDIASDADNVWNDPATVDAHVYLGWTYDFLFKQFGRQGLDGNAGPIQAITHPVDRRDFFDWYFSPDRDYVLGNYYMNAFWCPGCGPGQKGVMVFGEGLPTGITWNGRTWNYTAGGLDVIAHELTHGLTSYTSQLGDGNESGALNESFSDVIGTSVEFFYEPAGSGAQHADYFIGEDIVSSALRSMANPQAYGHPDHYSKRLVGSKAEVHKNAGIPNHAFYLAIEGGTNRTSGLRVTGVGAANRDQIEKVFYRAFVSKLTSRATFHSARVATIQSAREQYGNDSAAVRAVTEAWTAVGVN